MNSPKLTIILRSYNHADLVSQAIESALFQRTTFAYTILIVDNASTDGSVEIIQKYERQYPDKVRVIYREKNIGMYRSYLGALSETTTPYFTVLDADDYYTDKDYFQKAIDFLDSHEDYTIYMANLLVDDHGKKWAWIDTKVERADFSFEDYLHGKVYVPQEVGQICRNVVYPAIPAILTEAIDTPSEFAYCGDTFRFILHLSYGKAHLQNSIVGVYRILGTGLWTGLSKYEKNAADIYGNIAFDRFFSYKYHDFYVRLMRKTLKTCLDNLDTHELEGKDVQESAKVALYYGFKELVKSESSVSKEEDAAVSAMTWRKRVKYKIYLRLYRYLRRKLSRKGIIITLSSF